MTTPTLKTVERSLQAIQRDLTKLKQRLALYESLTYFIIYPDSGASTWLGAIWWEYTHTGV